MFILQIHPFIPCFSFLMFVWLFLWISAIIKANKNRKLFRERLLKNRFQESSGIDVGDGRFVFFEGDQTFILNKINLTREVFWDIFKKTKKQKGLNRLFNFGIKNNMMSEEEINEFFCYISQLDQDAINKLTSKQKEMFKHEINDFQKNNLRLA